METRSRAKKKVGETGLSQRGFRQDALAKDQFIDALLDDESRIRVRHAWTIEEKASFLAFSLKGSVLCENRKNFDISVKFLSNHFGASNQSELARSKFRVRV